MEILGIDVGGSGIKGAIVDTDTGELLSERERIPTPQKATPDNVADTIKELVDLFDYDGPVGCGFPTVVANGISTTFGNLDSAWKGTKTEKLFRKHTGRSVWVLNDADAAGLAEVTLGAGQSLKGKVLTITIGTGLGSGLFYNGVLVPNLELGRMLGKDGKYIERFASDRARKNNNLSWSEWGKRFDIFLQDVYRVVSPNYIILGGGASKKLDKFEDQITINTPVYPAQFRNNAGIIGAAMHAFQHI